MALSDQEVDDLQNRLAQRYKVNRREGLLLSWQPLRAKAIRRRLTTIAGLLHFCPRRLIRRARSCLPAISGLPRRHKMLIQDDQT